MSLRERVQPLLDDAPDAEWDDYTFHTNAAVKFKEPRAEDVEVGSVELLQNAVGFVTPLMHDAVLRVEGDHGAATDTAITWSTPENEVFLSVDVALTGEVKIDQVMKPMTTEALVRNSSANHSTRRAGGFGMGLKDAMEKFTNARYELEYQFASFDPDAPDNAMVWKTAHAPMQGTSSELLHVNMATNTGGRFETRIQAGLPVMRTLIRVPPGQSTTRHVDRLLSGFTAALGRMECMYARDDDGTKLETTEDGAFLSHDTFKPLVGGVAGHCIQLPPGGLFLVYGIFTAAPKGLLPPNLVVHVPGRGLPSEQRPVYDSHHRRVNEAHGTACFGAILDALLATKPLKLTMRDQLGPLLCGGRTLLVHNEASRALTTLLTGTGDKDAEAAAAARCETMRPLIAGKKALFCSEGMYAVNSYLAAAMGKQMTVIDHTVANPILFKHLPEEDLKEMLCRHSDKAAARGAMIKKGGSHFAMPAVKHVTGITSKISLRLLNDAAIREQAPAEAEGVSFRRCIAEGAEAREYIMMVTFADDDRTLMDVILKCARSEDETRRALALYVYLNHNNVKGIADAGRRLRTALDLMKRKRHTLDIGDPLRAPTPQSEPDDDDSGGAMDDSPLSSDDDEPPIHGGTSLDRAVAPDIGTQRKRARLAANTDPPERDYLADDPHVTSEHRIINSATLRSGYRHMDDGPEVVVPELYYANAHGMYLEREAGDPTEEQIAAYTDRKNRVMEAKDAVGRAVGLGRCLVYIAASPNGTYAGLHFRDGRIIINVATDRDSCDFFGTLVHELAHEESDAHDVNHGGAMEGIFVKARRLETAA